MDETNAVIIGESNIANLENKETENLKKEIFNYCTENENANLFIESAKNKNANTNIENVKNETTNLDIQNTKIENLNINEENVKNLNEDTQNKNLHNTKTNIEINAKLNNENKEISDTYDRLNLPCAKICFPIVLNASIYYLYRKDCDKADFEFAGTTKTNIFVDCKVLPNKIYYYRIFAYQQKDFLTELSEIRLSTFI